MKIRIKELCDKAGITSAYQLAKRANLTMPTAYRAFSDDIKQFTPETLAALCAALNATPNDIFGFPTKAVTSAETVENFEEQKAAFNSLERFDYTLKIAAEELEMKPGEFFEQFVKTGRLEAKQFQVWDNLHNPDEPGLDYQVLWYVRGSEFFPLRDEIKPPRKPRKQKAQPNRASEDHPYFDLYNIRKPG
ncbi:MAG TPA: helix-turn-helix domain-containing protein [Pyrinomonadaceae bacterium]|jgi:transcriptional regulator with XRE-family HTH domain